MKNCIGIDISKDFFDVYCTAGQEQAHYDNNSAGIKLFVRKKTPDC